MPKRANNEGSIRQRPDGLWEARYRDAMGNRKSVYGRSQGEVSVKLCEIRQRLSTGEYVEPSRITVEAWLHTWWTEYCVPTTRSNSAASAHQNIRNHLTPALGKVPLQQLQTHHIQSMVNRLANQKYAPATIRRIMATLRIALKQAETNQLILRNPAERIRLPKMEQKEIQVLSPGEQKLLLEALPDTDNARVIRFILGTGLRASEALGLRWQDIQGDRFTVKQAISTYSAYDNLEEAHTRKQIAPPKSNAGIRTIPLTDSMLAILDEQRQVQIKDKAEAVRLGLGWPKYDLIFSTNLGNPKDRHNLNRTLRQALEKAGLTHRGIHALRHTFATNAVQSNMDIRTLSEIIGHSKVAFTLQTYAHSDMDTKRKALEAMEAAQ